MRPRTAIVNAALAVAIIYAAIRACRDNPGLAWALALLVVGIGGMLAYGYLAGRRSCSGCIVEAMQEAAPTGRAFTLTPHSCSRSRWFYASEDGSRRMRFGQDATPQPRAPTVTTGRKRTKKQLTIDPPAQDGTVVHMKKRQNAAERRSTTNG